MCTQASRAETAGLLCQAQPKEKDNRYQVTLGVKSSLVVTNTHTHGKKRGEEHKRNGARLTCVNTSSTSKTCWKHEVAPLPADGHFRRESIVKRCVRFFFVRQYHNPSRPSCVCVYLDTVGLCLRAGSSALHPSTDYRSLSPGRTRCQSAVDAAPERCTPKNILFVHSVVFLRLPLDSSFRRLVT